MTSKQQSIALLTLTIAASGAVARARAVGFDGAQATVQGQKVFGVATTDAADGVDMAVTTNGTAVIETGAAVAVGDSLIVDADGRAIPATGDLSVAAGATGVTSSAANGAILAGADLPEYVFADAIWDAAGSGEFIEVMLRR